MAVYGQQLFLSIGITVHTNPDITWALVAVRVQPRGYLRARLQACVYWLVCYRIDRSFISQRPFLDEANTYSSIAGCFGAVAPLRVVEACGGAPPPVSQTVH